MILDTNALSALADGDEALAEKLRPVLTPSLPVIVLGEYRFGIQGSRDRGAYEAWLKESLEAFAVLSIDETTSIHYAAIRHGLKARGTPVPENDIWIAALGRQYRLPVVTKDRHFQRISEIQAIDW